MIFKFNKVKQEENKIVLPYKNIEVVVNLKENKTTFITNGKEHPVNIFYATRVKTRDLTLLDNQTQNTWGPLVEYPQAETT